MDAAAPSDIAALPDFGVPPSDRRPVQICPPDARFDCACPGGARGVQVCSADGTALGECTCPDAGTPDDGSGGDASIVLAPSLLVAHFESALYTLDPRSNAVARVGAFSFASGDIHNHVMSDLAVDAGGVVIGITRDTLYRVDPTTAACAFLATVADDSIIGMTFASDGVIPGVAGEVLVGGSSNGTYWRIDTDRGRMTRLGQLRLGAVNYRLSGDLVSVAGAGTFATVRSGSTASTSHDELATVDPATGAITLLGNTGFSRILGLGYYRDTLYGFTRNSALIVLNARTGAGRMLSVSDSPFVGAGVATTAPTTPP